MSDLFYADKKKGGEGEGTEIEVVNFKWKMFILQYNESQESWEASKN